MNPTPTPKRKIRIRTRVFVPMVFIIALLLITYAFPRQGSFKYSFDEGKPWQYGVLTAPFDFPIYKTSAELKAEQDSLLEYYEPYFIINREVQKNE